MLEVQECSFSRTITPELGLTSRSNVAVFFGRELHDASLLAILSIIHSGHSTGYMLRVKSCCFLCFSPREDCNRYYERHV